MNIPLNHQLKHLQQRSLPSKQKDTRHDIAPFWSSQWSCTDEMVIKRAIKILNFTGNRIDNRKMIGVGKDSYKFLLHASTLKLLLRMYNFFLPSVN
jgi:hypothetical protein